MDPSQQPETPDAPDKETMEQIRQRRLAKLGTSTPSAASPTNPPEAAPSSTGAATPKTETPSVAEGKEDGKQAEAPRVKINITPAARASGGSSSAAATAAASPAAPQPAPVVRRPNPAKEESLEDFADKTLAHIFRITVDPARLVDSHGHKLTFLPNTSQDLQDSGSPLLLSTEVLDSAILEAATAWPAEKPLLDYLLPCWKRVMKTAKLLRGPAPRKEEIIWEARRLCFSNCIFALTVPELFSREANAQHDTLVPYLLKNIEHENGVCLDFMNEAMARANDDDTIIPLFVKAMVDISSKLSSLSMNDDYKPSVNAMLTYARFPALLNALVQHPTFLMAQSAPGIEKHTLLGPFFRISPLQSEVTRAYFAAPRTMDKGMIKSSQDALRITLAVHQADLKTIINCFIRASNEARSKVLDWFAYIVNTNHKRRAMHVDPKEVASDGFMMNVTVILDILSEPFMDSTFSKVDRIDVDYFRRQPRVDIKDETKLHADQQQSDAFYATKVEGTSNFISEVFFLTLAAHHYGSEAANAKMKTLDKDIKYYENHIARMEAERAKFASNPAQLAVFEVTFKRHVDVMEKAMSLKLAIEGVLLDEKMQGRSLQFMRYVAVWLLRVASKSDYRPTKTLKLPLPEEQPENFRCLPEYALQDIVDNFKFVFRYVPQIILSAVGDEMIALCITFLESSEYVGNPYLKAHLVSLLYSGTWPTYHVKKGVLGDLLTNAKFANDYLLHAVMKFYIEAESTGAHTQFYDKFNIRYEIFQVIKCVWSNDIYKQQLTQQSRTNRSFFVRFVNLLMNDATYVLDEGLSKFPKIHDLQEALENPSLTPEERQAKEDELKTHEGQAQSYMQLANETVSMMKLFTNALSEAFTMPEIVTRLAGMLDYNLDILTGPKSRNLKVRNAEKYHFSPRTLLPELVDIYLNLGTSPAFIEAVASDGRSYKPDNFEATSRILSNRALKGPSEIAAWDGLRTKFAAAKDILDQAEQDFGEIPEEFEDPIMGDLMKDPVILPSKHIVDRSTIVQHLLSDPKDPFTRTPMTENDVVPAVELLERIEAWKRERKEAAKARIEDAMDTTE